RSQRSTDIAGRFTSVDGTLDGTLDPAGVLGASKRLEHEGRREDGAHRVCDVLSSEWRRGAMHRLEHRRAARVNVTRRRHAQTTLQRRANVRDDVAEQVV